MVVYLRRLKADVLADGRIDDDEVRRICAEIYADGVIDKEEVEFLVALRNEAKATCPSFERLLFQAVKECILKDGAIDGGEAEWLRETLFADGRIDDGEKRFLRELRAAASTVSPEFQRLYDECLRP